MELERIISVYTPQKMFSIMIRLDLDDIFPSIKIDGCDNFLRLKKNIILRLAFGSSFIFKFGYW